MQLNKNVNSITALALYPHGLEVSVDLNSGHLVVPGGGQVPLDAEHQVHWLQELCTESL